MDPLLQANNLTKNFGDKKGVFDVSFNINPGEIVGFVGPNGAGKSTMISMLCGNIYPDKGTINIFGSAITPTSIYRSMPNIGILLSEPTIENRITPKKLFSESEQLLGKKTDWLEMSDELRLDTTKPIGKLSLGNKKKVGIILALMHRPELVLMDEPTSGIDPVVVNKFGKLLKEVSVRGGSILLSSHDLNEIQDVCDRVIMIKSGKLLLDKPIDSLLKDASRKFTINNPPHDLRTELSKSFSKNMAQTPKGIVLHTQEYEKVIDILTSHNNYDFLVENPTLEEMFAEYYL